MRQLRVVVVALTLLSVAAAQSLRAAVGSYLRGRDGAVNFPGNWFKVLGTP
jgi:hypothetical protein